MTTTITVDKGDDFKTVIVIAFDKLHEKYRSINLGKRVIVPQLYESPEEVVEQLQNLKDQGRIKNFEVIKINDNK